MGRTFPIAVYAAMLGGTVGGQFLGMAVDTLALGRRILWVPLACSVLLEALVGARFGASRVGHRLAPPERLRLSLHYSLGLAGLSIPLVLWLSASHASAEQLAAAGGATPGDVLFAAGEVLLLLAACTVVRTALMALFTGRRA
ncbi:MAG TPA: hypothetical protein VIF09_07375 [Polyangiaceae bacterium]|jgi:hypothetical protein